MAEWRRIVAEEYSTGEVHVRDDNKLIVVNQWVGVDVGRTDMQLKCADAIHDVIAKWLDSKAGQVVVEEETFREFHDQHWADIDCAIWNFEEDIVTSGELPCDEEENRG